VSRLIFNAAKVTGEVEATAQIMQSFTQYAPKAVADYSSAKMNALKAEAKNETDPTKKEQLQEEAAKWDEGGAYRVAAHTIVGGLAGDIAGALGAGTSAATIPAVGDMINSTDLPSEVKQTLVALAGTAIGAAAGATTGDGGALTGGATGYAQTVNNYLNTVKMADGTYKVVGGKVDKDKNIYVVKSAEDQTRTGEVVGEMLFEDSFYFGDEPNDPKVTHRWRGIITQVAGIRDGKLTVVAHSEGTGETYAGMKYYEDELKALLGDKTTADFKVGFYGSPIGFENSSKLVKDLYGNSSVSTDDSINFDSYFRSSVNPGDPVGTLPIFLGGNGAGINNPSMSDGEFGYMFSRGVSSIANGKDPTNPSPHSGYTCVIGCGDNSETPELRKYFDTVGNKIDLYEFYKSHNLNSDFAKFAPTKENN
jgi:hypothetical protein